MCADNADVPEGLSRGHPLDSLDLGIRRRIAEHHHAARLARQFPCQAQPHREGMMLRLRFPRLECGSGFDGQRRRTRKHTRALAALNQCHAHISSQAFEFLQDAPRHTIPRALVLRVHRGHRGGIVKQYDQMFAEAGGSQPGARQNQRDRESCETFENQACSDRQLADLSAARWRLLHYLPEKQPCNGPRRETPPEEMNRHDCRNCKQGQQAEWRREDHTDSNTPAVARARAASRSDDPATIWTKLAPARRLARASPRRSRLKRSR